MSDTEAKTDPASDQKLNKKRKEGGIASSQDTSGLFGTAIGIAVIIATGAAMWEKIAAPILITPDILLLPDQEAIKVATTAVFNLLLWTVAPVVLATITVSIIVSLVLNKGLLFAMKAVTPNLERVSISKGVGRVYGKRGLLETVIAFVRLVAWLSFSIAVGLIWLPSLIKSTSCGFSCQLSVLHPLFWFLAIGVIVLMLLSAFVDIPIQKTLFLGEQKMTKSEVKKERKDQFGAPQIRQERNRIREESKSGVKKPMMSNANLVFFHGPQAIAVRYMPPDTTIPRVMAKARTAGEARDMKDALMNTGVHFIENAIITNGSMGESLGDPINVNCFEEFSIAVNKLLNSMDG